MIKPTVLFLDECCPQPYDSTCFTAGGIGGTELTVVMVAEALRRADLFTYVGVEQHKRLVYDEVFNYCPWGMCTSPYNYVICLRKPETLLDARERFPNAKLYLWSHDLYDRELAIRTMAVCQALKGLNILAVSQFHKEQIKQATAGLPDGYKANIQVVYNPVQDDLKPDSTTYNPNQMCYISSPHKGLDHALTLFRSLHSLNPSLELHVANPGYFKGTEEAQAGVVYRGLLSHREVTSLLRSSLCLFFPNTTFPETFGRVFAEAEAVGTPVLTHNLGAASEVLSHPSELVDCHNVSAVVELVKTWHKGHRPTVRVRPQFRMARVLQTWVREILI